MPILPVGVAWGVFGAVALVASGGLEGSGPRLAWFGAFWAFCMFDLMFMVRALAAVIHLMTEVKTDRRPARLVQAVFWGALKLLCLGASGFLTYRARGIAPAASLWTGVATIVIVPLAAGFWWSRQQLEEGH